MTRTQAQTQIDAMQEVLPTLGGSPSWKARIIGRIDGLRAALGLLDAPHTIEDEQWWDEQTRG